MEDDTEIRLYVRQVKFIVTIEQIKQFPKSFLYAQFCGSWNSEPTYKKGWYHDRNPKLFKKIWNFIVGNTKSLECKYTSEMIDEILYWGIFKSVIHESLLIDRNTGYSLPIKSTKEITYDSKTQKVIDRIELMLRTKKTIHDKLFLIFWTPSYHHKMIDQICWAHNATNKNYGHINSEHPNKELLEQLTNELYEKMEGFLFSERHGDIGVRNDLERKYRCKLMEYQIIVKDGRKNMFGQIQEEEIHNSLNISESSKKINIKHLDLFLKTSNHYDFLCKILDSRCFDIEIYEFVLD